MLLAGGLGERLYPLTRHRSKPAMPFGGTYRVIDFTLSNCVNSGLRRICLLTQHLSHSLVRHIRQAWSILPRELDEFIDTIPPQRRSVDRWYLGTADAIFQNIYTLEQERPDLVVVLSGDHIYKMDYRPMIDAHVQREADLTIAALPIPRLSARNLGVMTTDEGDRVVAFVEKPDDPPPWPGSPDLALVSMGIYVFNTESLVRAVVRDAKQDTEHDFGRNVIPQMVAENGRVFAYRFVDVDRNPTPYWRDIGTLDSYFESNMDLLRTPPVLSLDDPNWPIRTYQVQRSPTRLAQASSSGGLSTRDNYVTSSLISSGCLLRGARVERCVLSPGVVVDEAEVYDSILIDDVEVGRGARVRRAILDKGVQISAGARIGLEPGQDRKHYLVTKGGVTVLPKEMIVEE